MIDVINALFTIGINTNKYVGIINIRYIYGKYSFRKELRYSSKSNRN